jgi:hypothetical protein
MKEAVGNLRDLCSFENEPVQRYDGKWGEDHAVTRQLVLEMADQGGGWDDDSEVRRA